MYKTNGIDVKISTMNQYEELKKWGVVHRHENGISCKATFYPDETLGSLNLVVPLKMRWIPADTILDAIRVKYPCPLNPIPTPVYEGDSGNLIGYNSYPSDIADAAIEYLKSAFPRHDWSKERVGTEDSTRYITRGILRKKPITSNLELNAEITTNIHELTTLLNDLRSDLQKLNNFKLGINLKL